MQSQIVLGKHCWWDAHAPKGVRREIHGVHVIGQVGDTICWRGFISYQHHWYNVDGTSSSREQLPDRWYPAQYTAFNRYRLRKSDGQPVHEEDWTHYHANDFERDTIIILGEKQGEQDETEQDEPEPGPDDEVLCYCCQTFVLTRHADQVGPGMWWCGCKETEEKAL